MSKTAYINKRTFLHNFSGIIFIFVSMLLQVYYFFGYTDQGALYELIKDGEAVLYVFNAFVYVYVMWRLCDDYKPLSVALGAITPVIYTLHFAAYRVFLRIAVTSSPETKSEMYKLLLQGIKDDVVKSCVMYIIVFALMLAVCLFVGVVTPANIRHRLHVMCKSKCGAKTIINIERELPVMKALGKNLVVSQEIDGAVSEVEYEIDLEVIDWDDRSTYLVFTDNELNQNNHFNYYVGKRDRKNRLLLPVSSQAVLDNIEKAMMK